MNLSSGFGSSKSKQIDFLQLAAQLQSSGQAPAVIPASLKPLNITARKETTHHMRDGEVVLYLRSDSKVWQMRYKLSDRQWYCVSTRQRRLEWAMRVAGEHYDRARFREEERACRKRPDALMPLPASVARHWSRRLNAALSVKPTKTTYAPSTSEPAPV